jgi:protein-tyrosine phosphatase
MAEAVFRHKVQQERLDHLIEIDSAGTGPWHVGNLPHNGTLKVLAENGILTSHRARQISVSDLNYYDLIIVMDRSNLTDVQEIGTGSADIRLMMEFHADSEYDEVPDPYYTGEFGLVYGLVDAASDGLLNHVKSTY